MGKTRPVAVYLLAESLNTPLPPCPRKAKVISLNASEPEPESDLPKSFEHTQWVVQAGLLFSKVPVSFFQELLLHAKLKFFELYPESILGDELN